jgi:hypothetical protein
MMSKLLAVRDQVRASSVQRWHLVDTTKPQNVADHSFNVAMIGMQLCRLIGKPEWVPHVAVAALEHDLHEVIDGDMPSSAKEPKPWPISLAINSVVKAADVLECYFFISEYGTGSHAKAVVRWYEAKFKEMLEHFRRHPHLRDLGDAVYVTSVELVQHQSFQFKWPDE